MVEAFIHKNLADKSKEIQACIGSLDTNTKEPVQSAVEKNNIYWRLKAKLDVLRVFPATLSKTV
jgi:hypothetical protein